MAEEVYDVKANLELDRAGQAQSTLARISAAFSGLSSRLFSTNNQLTRMVRHLIAVGGTYLGIRALTSAFSRLTTSSVTANSSIEDMTVSLSTLMAEVEKITFSEATRSAQGLFRQLNDIATQSPATASELMDVFRGVYGPLRNAGTGMQDLLDFSKNAAAVGAALQIDYQQLSRDVGMMATGVAGVDVKTFRLLRSMGLITESTDEWNQMAKGDAAQAAQRLLEVFEQLGGPAADAFGRTWTGVSSTFRGIVQQFQRVFTGPSFRVVRDQLKSVNDFLLRYRSNIENVLSVFGTRIATRLNNAFMHVRRGLGWVLNNLDRIAIKLDTFVNRFMALKPVLEKVARVLLIAKVVSLIVGPLLSVVGAIGGMVSSLSGLAGLFGGGAGAVGAGAGAGAGAAGAAGVGGLGAILGTLAATLAPVIAIFGAIGGVLLSVWLGIQKFGESIMAAWEGSISLSEMFATVGDDLRVFFQGIWDFTRPILETLGALIIHGVIAAFRILLGVVSTITTLLRGVGQALTWLGTNVIPKVTEALHTMGSVLLFAFGELGNAVYLLTNVFRTASRLISGDSGQQQTITDEQVETHRRQQRTAGQAGGIFQNILAEIRAIFGAAGEGPSAPSFGAPPDAPGTRAQNVTDMRGSTINIRQEFKEADPDRVWVQTRQALEGEVERRTQSNFVSAFSR
jgi:hypothetical protein